ncbi:MAG: helix-turn-helix transcriptional regulator [Clostridia bacterium]|nr:helix-turn-helix transcriptional regulator [Clostridia bacterium]
MKSSIPLNFGDKKSSDFSFSHQTGDGGYECALHWHDCFEIFEVKGEPMKIALEDGEYELSRGDIAVFVPRALHGVRSLGKSYDNYVLGYTEGVIYSSEISSINMKYLAPFRYGRVKSFVVTANDPSALSISESLVLLRKTARDKSDMRELVVRSEILRVHAELYRISSTSSAVNTELSEYLMNAEEYIRRHISEDISPRDIADALHISYSHLARILKNNLATSAVEFINEMKISAAEQMMITDKTLRITDIAYSLGYDSPSYFTRKFKEIKGQSPSEFRKMLKLL